MEIKATSPLSLWFGGGKATTDMWWESVASARLCKPFSSFALTLLSSLSLSAPVLSWFFPFSLPAWASGSGSHQQTLKTQVTSVAFLLDTVKGKGLYRWPVSYLLSWRFTKQNSEWPLLICLVFYTVYHVKGRKLSGFLFSFWKILFPCCGWAFWQPTARLWLEGYFINYKPPEWESLCRMGSAIWSSTLNMLKAIIFALRLGSFKGPWPQCWKKIDMFSLQVHMFFVCFVVVVLFYFVELEIEPPSSPPALMVSGTCPTTELHSQPFKQPHLGTWKEYDSHLTDGQTEK